MTPAHERKAKERKAKQAAGLVRVEVWVKAEHAELVKGYAYGLRDISSIMARLAMGDK